MLNALLNSRVLDIILQCLSVEILGILEKAYDEAEL